MEVMPIKTEVMYPPKDDLLQKIQQSELTFQEGDVIAITSKVVSIWQGRCVMQEGVEKDELAKEEADYYIDRDAVPGKHIMITIKESVFVASAGIDASNSGEYYTLWPRKIQETAEELLSWFKKTYHLDKLGLIIVDSHVTPLRRGVSGMAIGWAGFSPVYDKRGSKDIFGKELKMTQINVADALASAAVFVMGEGNEQTPIAVIRNVPFVRFGVQWGKQADSYTISLEEDLFAPLIKCVPWEKGRKS